MALDASRPQDPKIKSRFGTKPSKIAFAFVVTLTAAGAALGKAAFGPSAEASQIWVTKPEAAAQQPQIPGVETLNKAFTDLAERMSPAVVNIYTKTGVRSRGGYGPGFGNDDLDYFFGNPFGGRRMPREAQALGSGFVLNNDGYIVTNAHVVRMAGRNADEIMVKLAGESNDDNSPGHPAKIIGVDEDTDVAVLQLTGSNRPKLVPAPLGDSEKSRVGEWVVAIGNPYGHTHTVTQGIVSAVGRSLEGVRAEFIQTSASINPGNSGGPLFNLAGEVIGINTAIDPRAQGIGFAIPINKAKQSITQLVTTGRVARPWMGIGIMDVTPEVAGAMKLSDADGVLVREVYDGQSAARAGLKTYDVIRKFNGQVVKNSRDLVRLIDKLSIGESAKVEILRDNQARNVEVKIGEQPRPTS